MPSVFEAEPLAIAQAAEIFGQAAREGRRVSIDRAGGDLVVSTRYLNRLLEHEAGDLTATVEAGIRLSALNERLAEHGQMLALDPPRGPDGRRSGRRRPLRPARPPVRTRARPHPRGDGRPRRRHRRERRRQGGENVAGYDLAKLFCGSHGRLGLIGRVSLRLHPRPEASRTLAIPVAAPDEVHGLVRALLHSTLAPSAVDLVWSAASPPSPSSSRAARRLRRPSWRRVALS